MPQLGNFRGKLLSSRTFVWNKTFIIGLLWTYTLIFWNQFFLKIALSYSFFESWILNIQSWSLNQIGFNLIWRSNSATVSKQSESIFETNMGNVFCILRNFVVHLRHIICYLFYELWYVRRICERSLSKTLLQSTKNVLSETTILFRSSHQRCSKKNLFLKISQYSQEKIYVPWSLFLIKLQDWSPATLFRIDPNTGFSCEYCGILNYRPLSLPFSSQFLKGLEKNPFKEIDMTQKIWKYFPRCRNYEKKSLQCAIMNSHRFHAPACTTDMRRAAHIGCWISSRSKKTDMKFIAIWISYYFLNM